MNKLVFFAIIFVNSALVLYTLAVISENRSKTLKRIHAIEFWIAFICNILGMGIMSTIENNKIIVNISQTIEILHVISGGVAIILMLFHALWATWVLLKGSKEIKEKFHKLNIFIWLIWLIPYGVGMYIGIFG
ncbi:HsmA family protein [Clostridium tarantellae]|uniref:TIGR03987 family protein n=1 Tax=Clostridium tarantellae TaxID=39493 RepID=A0A6I1MJ90_9CLOT|nr:TIGR03987 family protein [Clostridium tarantellae]